jgi:hypothetical protein
MSNRQYRDNISVITIQCNVTTIAELNHTLPKTGRHVRGGPAYFWRRAQYPYALPNRANGAAGSIPVFRSEKAVEPRNVL